MKNFHKKDIRLTINNISQQIVDEIFTLYKHNQPHILKEGFSTKIQITIYFFDGMVIRRNAYSIAGVTRDIDGFVYDTDLYKIDFKISKRYRILNDNMRIQRSLLSKEFTFCKSAIPHADEIYLFNTKV